MSNMLDGMIDDAASLLDVGEVHTNPEYLRGMAELIAVCVGMSVVSGRRYVIEQIEIKHSREYKKRLD